MGSLASLVFGLWTPKGTPQQETSPEQVMQEMPSALRLYLRSSSTWMLVSGRKSSGARLAGLSRLANTRDRTSMETKSPGRKGHCDRRGWGPGRGDTCTAGASRAPGKSCSLYGEEEEGRYPKGVGRDPARQPVGEDAGDHSPEGRGRLSCMSPGVGLQVPAHIPGQEAVIILEP